MRPILIILLSLTSLRAHSQTYNADSVELIFTTLPDSIKIREATNISRHYLDVDFEKSLRYARIAHGLINRTDNQHDIAYVYINWAIAQYNFGRYDSCLVYNFKALKMYQQLSDTSKMATAYNNISGAYNAIGDHSSAVYYGYKAFNIHNDRKNWQKVAVACLNLASSFYEAKDYPATLSWSRKAYTHYEIANKPADLGYALQVYVDVYIARKQIDSALLYLDEIRKLNTTYPNEYLLTVNQAQRGEVYYLQGKYDSAIVMYNRCIKFYEDADLGDAVLHTRLNLSRAHMALNKLDDARRHAMDAFERSKAINNKIMIVKSSDLLVDVLTARREFEKALQYAQIRSVYRDSIMVQSLKGSIEGRFFDVKLENETREKIAAITTLQRQDTLIARQWTVIIVVTVGLVAMIVIAGLIRNVGRYRKRMNDQLTTNNKRLSELNEEINGLVNTIVHDLKSPLNSVTGILSLVEMNAGNNTETKTLVAMAKKSIANGHDIIRQLLELREVEENKAEVHLAVIDTNEFLKDICESFSPAAREKDIKLSMTADTPSFTSDKILLRRVIDNLVSNAIKFSPGGKEVKLSVVRENGNVVFRVSDQGPGFSKEDLLKVYGKFQKLSARPTAGEMSNGLGLATVQALTRYLNGSIELKTEVGEGSTFVLTLPGGR